MYTLEHLLEFTEEHYKKYESDIIDSAWIHYNESFPNVVEFVDLASKYILHDDLIYLSILLDGPDKHLEMLREAKCPKLIALYAKHTNNTRLLESVLEESDIAKAALEPSLSRKECDSSKRIPLKEYHETMAKAYYDRALALSNSVDHSDISQYEACRDILEKSLELHTEQENPAFRALHELKHFGIWPS